MSRLGIDNPDNSPLFVFYNFTEGSTTEWNFIDLPPSWKCWGKTTYQPFWDMNTIRGKIGNWFMKQVPADFELQLNFGGPAESKEEAKIYLDNYFKGLQEEGTIAKYMITKSYIP
jgi:hypothetical protein